MHLLSRTEEIIMVTILKLEGNAYGVSIREQIFQDTGKYWSFASIYQPLNKLLRKEFVRKIKSAPTAERGGKSKFLYELTPEGKQALLEIRQTNEQVWAGAPRIVLDNGK